jgi:hypothetical protein
MSAQGLTQQVTGRWISGRKYAEIHDLAPQTLANWRHKDRQAGRNSATEGYPQYRRFGCAVRYYLPTENTFPDPQKQIETGLNLLGRS